MAPGDESSTLEIMPAAGLRPARPRAPHFPLLYQLMRGACAPVLRRLFGLAELALLPVRAPKHDPGIRRLFFELSCSVCLLNCFRSVAELNVDRRDPEQRVRFPRTQFHRLFELF